MTNLKKVISICLAMVMVTSTSSFALANAAQASSVTQSESTTLDSEYFLNHLNDILRKLLDGFQYTDGVISGFAGEEINDQLLNDLVEEYIGKYIDNGQWLVDYGDKYLTQYVDQYTDMDTLTALIKDLVLADNSTAMQAACGALSQFIPIDTTNGATYTAIIKGIIPILSCFSFDVIMGGDFTVASPMAFYYLAGLDSTGEYLASVNSTLAEYGIEEKVEPVLTLSAEQEAELQKYAAMERNGASLAEVKEAGFDWTQFVTDENATTVANALVMVDLGDANKLGGIIEGLSGGATDANPGADLAYILVDFINDVYTDPIRTIVKKLGSKQFGSLVSFAVTLLDGLSTPDFATYTDIFDNDEYNMLLASSDFKDEKGELYDFIEVEEVDDGEGGTVQVYSYKHGALDKYLDVVDSAKNLLAGLYDTLEANDEDILKTLLVDKLPDFEDLLYKGVKLVVDIGSSPVEHLKDQITADTIKIRFQLVATQNIVAEEREAQAAISEIQALIDELVENIQSKQLAIAITCGLLPEGTDQFSEAELEAGVAAKVEELTKTLGALESQIESLQAEIETLQAQIDEIDAKAAETEKVLGDMVDVIDRGDITDADFISNFNTYVSHYYDGDELVKIDGSAYDFFCSTYAEEIADENWELLSGEFNDLYLAATMQGIEASKEEYDTAISEKSDTLATLGAQAEDVTGDITACETDKAMILAIAEEETIFVSGDPDDPYSYSTLAELNSTKASREETLTGIQAQRAESEEKTKGFQADIEQCEAEINKAGTDFDSQLKDFESIASELVKFIRGNGEPEDTLYARYKSHELISTVFSGERLGCLERALYNAANIFNYFDIVVNGEAFKDVKSVQELVKVLFSGVLGGLYEDLLEDPIASVTKRVPALAELVNIVDKTGVVSEFIAPYMPLVADVTSIFDDDFNTKWAENRVTALMSSLPKVKKLLDDALQIETLAKFAEPYKLAIDTVVYLLSEECYTELYKDPIGYALREDNLTALFGETGTDGYIGQLLDMFMTDEELKASYFELIEVAYDSIIRDLYSAFLEEGTAVLNEKLSIIGDILHRLPEVGLSEEYVAVAEDVLMRVQYYLSFFDTLKEMYAMEFEPGVYTEESVAAYFAELDKHLAIFENLSGNETVETLVNYAEELSAAFDLLEEIHYHDEETLEGYPATCTEPGLTDGKYCPVCEEVLVEQKVIDPLGHSFTDYKSNGDATCTKDGTKTAKCDRCEVTNTVTDTGSKLGHTEVSKVTKATFTVDGRIDYFCDECGEKTKDSDTIAKVSTVKLAATSYEYNNGKAITPAVTVKDSAGKTLTKGKDYDVTYASGRKDAGKTYKVTVTLKGNYSGKQDLTFKIVPKTTSISKVSAISKGFKVTWKKQATQTTGYVIEYTTDKNFKKSVKKVTVKSNKTTSYTVKKLSAKKKYYVRVYTYKSGTSYLSKASGVKSVTTKK